MQLNYGEDTILDDCNMFEGHNPRAYLVEMPQEMGFCLSAVISCPY